MKAKDYIERFGFDRNRLVMELSLEFTNTIEKRNYKTHGQVEGLFRELENKWKAIANRIDADEDLFYHVIAKVIPEIVEAVLVIQQQQLKLELERHTAPYVRINSRRY